jgi:hypothetical protein
MTKDDRNTPTMIIPRGTEITTDEHGQLSIVTPGTLVIQNSGTFAQIRCIGGSLRIDPEVSVEAISVVVADACFVAGALTAWEVKASKIVLEQGSQACVMVRDSETLEVHREARLIGNFGSEQELQALMDRFGEQLRRLPSAAAPAGASEPAGEEDEENADEPLSRRAIRSGTLMTSAG